MSKDQHFQVAEQDGVTVLYLAKDFSDRKYILEFEEALLEFVQANQPKLLLLSFENVSFYSSEAIKALIHAKKRLVEYDGKIALCCMKSELREVLEIVNLVDTVFPVYETVQEACGALKD